MAEYKLRFEKATKEKAKLRMAFAGPAKSGKTYTALVLATELANINGGRIGLIDTERGSSRKYADIFDFDVMELPDFHPETYIKAIRVFEDAGHSVIILDSISHAWEGNRGVLDLHEEATARRSDHNSWAAWRDVTPIQRALVDAMLGSVCHIIATMRSKMAYIQTQDDRGRTTIRKVGMAPVQRQGMEYEFDIKADIKQDHTVVIGETRCPAVDGQSQNKPDGAWFQPIIDWLSDGVEPQLAFAEWFNEFKKTWYSLVSGVSDPGALLQGELRVTKSSEIETGIGRERAMALVDLVAFGQEHKLGLLEVKEALDVQWLRDWADQHPENTYADGTHYIEAWLTSQEQPIPAGQPPLPSDDNAGLVPPETSERF